MCAKHFWRLLLMDVNKIKKEKEKEKEENNHKKKRKKVR